MDVKRIVDAGPLVAWLVVLSELHPRAVIVTVDVKDFRVYRRFRREALPLLMP